MAATTPGVLRAAPVRPAARGLVLAACIAGSSVAFLDVFVVNVALPAIGRDLGGGLAGQQWVTNAYLLALGSLLLLGGSLGDVFGARRVFAAGVGAFGVASVGCALAPGIGALVTARAAQGVAAALLVPSTLAVIVATYPDDERGRAIGTWTAWTGVATVAGPLLGGQVVEAASWRWVFALNVPLVLVTLGLVAVALPPSPRPSRRPRVDAVGAALAALGLGGPVFALIQQPRWGWTDPRVLVALVGGLVLLGLFAAVERRREAPMVPPALFRRRSFAVGNLITVFLYAGLAALLFFLTIFLQQVAGYSPLQAGMATAPTTAVLFLLSRRFGALSDRWGRRAFLTAGPLLAGAGMLLLLRVGPRPEYVTDVLPALLLFAVGLAMTVAPLTAAVLACVEEDHAGAAAGVNSAVARVAELLAIAAVGLLVAGRFSAVLDDRLDGRPLSPAGARAASAARDRPLRPVAVAGVAGPERAALERAATDASVAGFRAGMGLGGGLVALAGVVAWTGVPRPRREVRAEGCAGGAIAGHPDDDAACRPPAVAEVVP